MSKNALDQYFMALERLIAGRPINISKGYKITNSSVALEAGRSKGSIKKSRVIFQALIDAIEVAGINHSKSPNYRSINTRPAVINYVTKEMAPSPVKFRCFMKCIGLSRN